MAAVKKFKEGDLVWGKMRSFPAWPARVLDPPKDKRVHVYFFGTKDHAFLAEKFVTPHSRSMLTACKRKKMSLSLRAAVKEFEQVLVTNTTGTRDVSLDGQGYVIRRRPTTLSASLKVQLKLKYQKLRKRKSILKPKVSRKKDPEPREPRSIPTDLPYNLRSKVVPEPVPEVVPEPIEEAVPEPIQEVVPEPIQEVVPEPIQEVVPEPIPEAVQEPIPEAVPLPIPVHIPEPLPPEPSSSVVPVHVVLPQPLCGLCKDSKRRGATDPKVNTPCCGSLFHMSCIVFYNRKYVRKRCPDCRKPMDIGLRIKMTEQHKIEFAYEFRRYSIHGLWVGM